MHVSPHILTLIGQEILMIKSTYRGCFFIGTSLVFWHSKKQNYISLSIAKAEYIADGSSYTQLQWMKQMLSDYGIDQETMVVYCNNKSTINIFKYLVQHSKTKHIDIWYHYIHDLVNEHIVRLSFVHTERQLANILTKSLDKSKFYNLRQSLGICVIE